MKLDPYTFGSYPAAVVLAERLSLADDPYLLRAVASMLENIGFMLNALDSIADEKAKRAMFYSFRVTTLDKLKSSVVINSSHPKLASIVRNVVVGRFRKFQREHAVNISKKVSSLPVSQGAIVDQPHGFSSFVEGGKKKTAETVDPMLYGPHGWNYASGRIEDCPHGCGCWAGAFRSGGPVDPFGACPNNPKH